MIYFWLTASHAHYHHHASPAETNCALVFFLLLSYLTRRLELNAIHDCFVSQPPRKPMTCGWGDCPL